MPFSITCPSCSAKLKTATAIPIGRSVQCPKCKNSFAVSTANMVEVSGSQSGITNPAGKSSTTTAAAKTPPKKAPAAADNPFGALDAPSSPKARRDEVDDDRPRKSRRDEDDEDARPRKSRRDEEDDERPRSRRRVEEDDDRPRKKLRDDDEDDAPRSRKRRDDDDDDRPRRHRDDDDLDDDDRPRKKKKKQGNLYKTIGIAVGGLALVTGLVFLFIWLLGGSGGTYDTEMLAYLPADSNVVAGFGIEELNKNDKLKELIGKVGKKSNSDPLKEMNDKLKPAGLTIDDLSRVVMGGNTSKDEPTFVLRAKKSFDKAKFAEAMEVKQEKKKGDKTYYTNGQNKVIYFPTDSIAVMTHDKHFETLASKSDSNIALSEDMQDLAKKMSKGHLWVAISSSVMPKNDMAKGLDMVKMVRIPYFPPELIDAVKDMKSAGFWIKLDGDSVKLGLALVCNSKETAEKAETALKKDIDEQRNKNISDDPLLKNNPLMQGKDTPNEIKSLMTSIQKSMAADRSGAMIEMSTGFNLSDAESVINLVMSMQGPPPQPQRFEPQPAPKSAIPKKKFK